YDTLPDFSSPVSRKAPSDMTKIKKILAPADMSNLCISGIRFALELAQWQQSEVLIYNVLTVEETPFPQGTEEWVVKQAELPKLKKTLDQRKKLLADFISKEFADLIGTTKIRQEVEIGTPYRRIVDKAAAESVDIIVMSTHGRTGLAHMLIGSVTERVLRRASCPVLAVPVPRQTKRLSKRLRKTAG
ncbi:MAG TPA: universal stress protein, partial [Candidatus Binatia bacterium]|nr:universal stress protein [Candidatus Binatia bacterium]